MKKTYLILPILAGIMFGSSGIFVRTLTQNGIDQTTLLFLRFSIAIFGANTEYYEVNVINPADNIELNGFPIENISHSNNKTTYIMNSNYNEMELLSFPGFLLLKCYNGKK